MEEVLKALAINVPAAMAVIATVYMFLRAEERRETRREQNAKDKEVERREHEIKVQGMWATNIGTLIGKYDETYKLINNAIGSLVNELRNHDDAEQERYKKMHITQDLLKAAREAQLKER